MCMDALGRAHLSILEAIRLIAEDVKAHTTHDPGVAEAVLARLRDAEAQLREVQAGFSRKESWRVIRKVGLEVLSEILQLIIRATATHSNSDSPIRHHASWNHYSKTAHGKRLVSSRPRQARACIRVFPVPSRARQTRAHTLGLASPSRRAAGPVWRDSRKRTWRCPW